MTITPAISLTAINVIAFSVYTYCLLRLIPILHKIIVSKKAKHKEILIQGQNWKINYRLISMVTLPFVGFVAIILFFVWVGIRMI